jgi:hypothetical protein
LEGKSDERGDLLDEKSLKKDRKSKINIPELTGDSNGRVYLGKNYLCS